MEPLEALVRQAQSGDVPLASRQDAFGELVRRFQDLAYGYAYALLGDVHLAEDAAQEAFLTAYRQLAQLREPAAFPGWLRRIVRTHCLRLRRGRQPATIPIEAEIDPTGLDFAVSRTDPAALAEQRETQELVAAAIAALPDRERVATVLFYLGGYAQQEIAQFLDVPVTTVKKRLQASRKRMQERMLTMLRDTLQQQGPSGDERFVETVQFFAAFEAAAADGEQLLVELLLLDGLDVNSRGKDGRTLLCMAAQRGHLDAAEFLIERGADVNARDKAGKTALQWAIAHKHRTVAGLLRRGGMS